MLNYVSLFTLSILNISLRIGAKNLGLLISTTFIKIPLSSTAHYSENDYYNRKYSCYPNSRTATSNDTANTESYPQIIPSFVLLIFSSVYVSPLSSISPENATSTSRSVYPFSAICLLNSSTYRTACSLDGVTTIAFALPPILCLVIVWQ